MFEEGWLSLILEEGPLTRDVDMPFCSDEGLNSCSACWVSCTGVDGSDLMEQTQHHLVPSTIHHCAYKHNQQEVSHHSS